MGRERRRAKSALLALSPAVCRDIRDRGIDREIGMERADNEGEAGKRQSNRTQESSYLQMDKNATPGPRWTSSGYPVERVAPMLDAMARY
jgi:hypothetical protein